MDLEKEYKKFLKKLQKIAVEGIGATGKILSDASKSRVKSSGETELETAKTTLANSSKSLKTSVKGEFGKKLTEIFKKQQETLDSLK